MLAFPNLLSLCVPQCSDHTQPNWYQANLFHMLCSILFLCITSPVTICEPHAATSEPIPVQALLASLSWLWITLSMVITSIDDDCIVCRHFWTANMRPQLWQLDFLPWLQFFSTLSHTVGGVSWWFGRNKSPCANSFVSFLHSFWPML